MSKSGACSAELGGQSIESDCSVLTTLDPVGFECIKFHICKTGTNGYFILTLPFLLKNTAVGKLTVIFLDVRQ